MSPRRYTPGRRATFAVATATATVIAVAAALAATSATAAACPAPRRSQLCAPDTLAGDITFSAPSGTFTKRLSVTLGVCGDGSEIRYTTNGELPTASSPRYLGRPIQVTTTTRLRAQAFTGGQAVGDPGTALYIASSVTTEHDLPVIVLDTFGSGTLQRDYTDAAALTFDPDKGTARLSDSPALASRAALKLHGQSSTEWPKPGYRLEMRGNDDKDIKIPLLGMPADADWVLRASYMDKSFIRDPLAYTLGPAMGTLTAPRYQFAEVYLNTDGGVLTNSDYWGVYLVSETIKVSKDRTNIAKLKKTQLTSPEIEGGYIIKFEEGVSEEPRLYCAGKRETCWRDLEVAEPDDIQPEQLAWINNYVQRFHDVLHSPDFADPDLGYAAWIDVPSFVDHMIITELARNIDGYVRSTYFYKDRGGKLTAGPLWDYDLSWGIGGNGTFAPDNLSIDGWHYATMWPQVKVNDWFPRLISDPTFAAQVSDRWRKLREGVLSDEAIAQRVNTLATGLDAAAERNFNRWPILGIDWIVNWARTPATKTWQEQLDYTVDWTTRRAAWIDTQWG